MDSEHKKILVEIKKHAGKGTQHSQNDSYILSGHVYHDVSVPIRRQIAKTWLKEHKDISAKDFIAVLDSLYTGKSHEEKTIAGILLGYHPVHRGKIGPKHLDKWLSELIGWAEIDSLCQNNFTADELLRNWKQWEIFIRKLSGDTNINKRRAALVLLTGPAHRSKDVRIRDLSFAMIDTLKHEKEIIITKAISWLLREMTALHKKEVATYLKKNADTLPKIALRETQRKIETGRK